MLAVQTDAVSERAVALPDAPSGSGPNARSVGSTAGRAGTLPTVPPQSSDPLVPTAPSDTREDRLTATYGLTRIVRFSRGGMGDLYHAWAPSAGRAVVVKFIRPDACSLANLRRFGTEARSLARLGHPNIAHLFAAEDGIDPYFVMEYLSGGSVADWLLVEGQLPPDVAARILRDAARGVAAAHRLDIIHRDLKPSNLLLSDRTPDAVPKVADFGMAKDLDEIDGPTGSRAVLGTPGYLAPEQATRSSECDARTDVWGLAATLYCCVTGQPPFDRADPTDVVATGTLVPPKALRPDLPADLDAIIRKGLEKHPNDRYQTADAFADDLDRYLTGQPVVAARRSRMKPLWRRVRTTPKGTVAALVVAVVAVLALGGVLLRERPPAVAAEVPEAVLAEQRMEFKMGQLKAGNPVLIFGEKGIPDWHRQPRGVGYHIDAADEADGACTVSAVAEAWCQLTPELPIDDYTLTVELRDLRSGSAYYHVAAGVCSEVRPDANGNTHAQAVQLLFTDSNLESAVNGLSQSTKAVGRVVHELELPSGRQFPGDLSFGELPFIPSRPTSRTGCWRTLKAVVSPAGVELYWLVSKNGKDEYTLVGKQTRAQLNAVYALTAGDSAQHRPETTLVPAISWSPTRPFVVSVFNATVGVRNLKIVPTVK